MEDPKVICCGDSGNNDLMTAMACNGGMGGQWNNPFIYLVWMMFAQRMWNNGDGGSNAETQRQIATLQNAMQDNHNSDLIMSAIRGNADAISTLSANLNCDFNTLQQAVCGVKSAVEAVGGQVGYSAERVINAVQMGDCQVAQAVKDCCCNTQKAILESNYQNQLANERQTNALSGIMTQNQFGVLDRMRDLGNGIQQGFSASAYATQQQTCDIIQAGNANTQRIIDTMNSHWNQELQQKYADAKLELSQLNQNATLIAALKTT